MSGPPAPDAAEAGGARLSRREVVLAGGRAAVLLGGVGELGWLTGCGSSRPARPGLTELARRVKGAVVAMSDPGYPQARRLFNPQFDGARPLAVVFCESPADVAETIAFGRRRGIAVSPRAGGHSFGGYSAPDGAIVADVSRMRRISVNEPARVAAVGAGAQLIDVNSALSAHGLAIPGGTCPTVGIAGLTLGGGFGFSSRKLGLTADNLVEVELVTATGQILRASSERHPDLFWACRGGGGGNFAIATSFRFRLHSVAQVAIYQLEWAWSDAAAVLDAWQRWAPEAPDALFSTCSLNRSGGSRPSAPTITSQGQFFGSPAELTALLGPLLSAARPTRRRVASVSFLDAQKLWEECPPAQCRQPAPDPYTVKSDFFTAPLPREAIATVIGELERWPGGSSPQNTGVQLNSWGGAIARVPAQATAFVHRDARVLAIYGTAWGQRDAPARVAVNRAWLQRLYARMRPYASGYAYQNLIDRQLADWRHAYYGANLPRLVVVKRRYDPGDFFRFAQGVPTRL